MKQKGEGEVGLVWRAGLHVRQARHFATGLAIWLANLLLPIRVQTTLLQLNVSPSWSRFEKPEIFFFDVDIVVKHCVVCMILLSTTICVITVVKFVVAVPPESTTFWLMAHLARPN